MSSNNSRKKIVFFAYHSTSLLRQYWDQLKDQADCCWVTFSPVVYEELKRSGYSPIHFKSVMGKEFEPVILYKIIRKLKSYFAKQLYRRLIKKTLDKIDPDIIISNIIAVLHEYKSRALQVLVFHSAPYKKHILLDETLNYDLVLLPSEHHKKTICERYTIKEPERFKVVGWPRIDDFINNKFTEEDRSLFAEKLGLDPKLKNVLYAPTWNAFRDKELFPRSFGDRVEAFEEFCKRIKEFNVNLIIRLHSVSSNLVNDPRLHKIAEKYDVYFARGLKSEYLDNLAERYLWSTDVLISDVSGMISDFVALNRPMIYIDPDAEEYDWNDADLPADYRAGIVARSLEELVTGVKRSLDNPQEYEDLRREIGPKIFHKLDGRASERATQAILDFYDQAKVLKKAE